MKKVKVISLNDKNLNTIVSSEIDKNGVDSLYVKETKYGLEVKYFTGTSHREWVNKFYPWYMIREILL